MTAVQMEILRETRLGNEDIVLKVITFAR